MFTYNLWMDCLHPDKSCQLFCPVINIAMSNNLNTLLCILHNFSSTKLDLFIQALLLDYILAEAKNTRTPCVHLVFTIFFNIFKTK